MLWSVLTLLARPVLVGLCLLPARLHRHEVVFVLFAGLKGAVPILLGSFLLAADVPAASVRGDTRLLAGDEVFVTAEDRWHAELPALFRA